MVCCVSTQNEKLVIDEFLEKVAAASRKVSCALHMPWCTPCQCTHYRCLSLRLHVLHLVRKLCRHAKHTTHQCRRSTWWANLGARPSDERLRLENDQVGQNWRYWWQQLCPICRQNAWWASLRSWVKWQEILAWATSSWPNLKTPTAAVAAPILIHQWPAKLFQLIPKELAWWEPQTC